MGETPYTGMEPSREFLDKLRDGYRMEKPDFAPQNIYEMMLRCWNKEASERPVRLLERYDFYIDKNFYLLMVFAVIFRTRESIG